MESRNSSHLKPRKQAPRLLSTVYGKIEQVLLTQGGFQTPYSDLKFQGIRNVFREAGIETITMVNQMDQLLPVQPPGYLDLENQELLELLARGRDIEISTQINLEKWHKDFEAIRSTGLSLAQTQWAQDPFCVQKYDDRYNLLFQPIHSDKITDQFISLELSLKSELNLLVRPTNLRLEGGNILVGSDFALIGLNTLGINWIEFLKDDFKRSTFNGSSDKFRDPNFLNAHLQRLKQQFTLELGVREVIWVGFPAPRLSVFSQDGSITFQPAYHLDLFITLGGKDRSGEEIIFVADPGLGKSLLKGVSKNPINYGLNLQGDPFMEEMVNSYFDDIANFFSYYNQRSTTPRCFRVVRLPMLIEQGVAYTFNNSLMEVHSNGNKRAFVPNYISRSKEHLRSRRNRMMNEKMEFLQDQVQKIFQHEEIEVVWTGTGIHLQNFVSRKGSLRCVSKVLRRRQI